MDAAPNGINKWLSDIIAGDRLIGRSVIQSIPTPPEGFQGSGYGLLCEFIEQPETAATIVRRLSDRLGLRYFSVAVPSLLRGKVSEMQIQSVAICAGSGWDVLKDCKAQMVVTGEMSHHNALKAVQEGKVVVTVFHSHSERGYLNEVLQPLLLKELRAKDPYAAVVCSEMDEDPFVVIDVTLFDENSLTGPDASLFAAKSVFSSN
jgi:putative NIF3 family GTP cyclohydrolase 1 type 2